MLPTVTRGRENADNQLSYLSQVPYLTPVISLLKVGGSCVFITVHLIVFTVAAGIICLKQPTERLAGQNPLVAVINLTVFTAVIILISLGYFSGGIHYERTFGNNGLSIGGAAE